MGASRMREHILNSKSYFLLLVRFLGVEEFLFGDVDGGAVGCEGLEEAALVAGVAGSADLLDFKEEGIGVAIGGPADDLLGVAAGFALDPEFLPGAAPVVHEAGLESGLEGGGVHPGHHEDAARLGVLNDGGDEAVGVEFERWKHGKFRM